MEDKFKCIIGSFMLEMQTTAFRNYKETDESYIEIELHLKRNEEKFNKIIGSLPDQDKNLLKST